MTPFRSDRFRLVPRPRSQWLRLAWFAGALLALLAMPLFPFGFALLLLLLLVGGMLPSRRLPPPAAGVLAVGVQGVTWNQRLLAERGDITSGLIVPAGGGGFVVRLFRRFPRALLELAAPDEREAGLLLAHLGLDASQAAVTIPFASRVRASTAGAILWPLSAFLAPFVLLFGLLAVVFGDLEGLFYGALFVVPTALWVGLNFVPSTVRIGTDGILVSWMGATDFIAHDDIAELRPYAGVGGGGIAIRTRSGRELLLPRMSPFAASLDRSELDLVLLRVRQAIEQQRRAQRDRALILPSRGERSTAEWVAALRTVGTGAHQDHRTAPIDADRLLRIAEDAGASPELRLSAAIAISEVADDASRRRLRIAAEASADPEVRAALELSAEREASEAELGAALERMSRLHGR